MKDQMWNRGGIGMVVSFLALLSGSNIGCGPIDPGMDPETRAGELPFDIQSVATFSVTKTGYNFRTPYSGSVCGGRYLYGLASFDSGYKPSSSSITASASNTCIYASNYRGTQTGWGIGSVSFTPVAPVDDPWYFSAYFLSQIPGAQVTMHFNGFNP